MADPRLLDIVARLRGEGGCDWDRAQTAASMAPFLLEEAWELVDAIERGDTAETRQELGDVSFVVAMITRIHEEAGHFDAAEVERDICAKMIRRHPHVFGDTPARPDWQALKQAERSAATSLLDGVPDAMPALLRAQTLTDRAAGVGFDWPDTAGVRRKLDEELHELDDTLRSDDLERIEDELGDVLFTVVNLARKLGLNAETALRKSNRKFSRRFTRIEEAARASGRPIQETPLDTLEAYWQAAKSEE